MRTDPRQGRGEGRILFACRTGCSCVEEVHQHKQKPTLQPSFVMTLRSSFEPSAAPSVLSTATRASRRSFLTTLPALTSLGLVAAFLVSTAAAEPRKGKHDWPDKSDKHSKHSRGHIIVANRGTTNISVIDVRTD